MKKIYSRPEWELTILETEDVISTSNGDGVHSYGNVMGDRNDYEIWDF